MGLFIDQEQFEEADYVRFEQRLQESLVALEQLLQRPGFGEGPVTLWAELELTIIDSAGRALPLNRTLLAQSLDPRLQLELDRFNLEYNLSPVPARGAPFAALEAEMQQAIGELDAYAGGHGGSVVSIGILPTLSADDLQADAMTDLPRYRALSAGLRRLHSGPYEVRIDGEEPLSVTCDDVTLEGANTALQLHIRVDPALFAAAYNAIQIATAPALALAANSPVFLGHRLWDETRVALFKQAVDVRAPQESGWRLPARVSFGHGWVREGAYELFAEAVALYPCLLPVTGDEDPLEPVRSGELPRLDELRLHQGTVWRWNRAIYDPSAGGHVRIEMRALPSGPTPIDMVASAAFLIGLSQGLRSEMDRLLPAFPFEYAEHNFYRAAQFGLDAPLLWPSLSGPSPRELRVRELIPELLPLAEQGLASLDVEESEIQRLLDVIRARLETGTTPARWQQRMLDRLDRRVPRSEALAQMLACYLREAKSGRPVTEWSEEP